MNLFDQYVEKILFEFYHGNDTHGAREAMKEIVRDIVASALYDTPAVDEFLDHIPSGSN